MVEVFNIPILFNTFNRPSETNEVLSVIRSVRPSILFVHCDGPRESNRGDEEQVSLVHQILDTGIDWPCEVHKLYEENNLGCGRGPAASISWFFSNVDRGIILEDDCKPHRDFFYYCQELLDKYKDNEEIGIISGACFDTKKRQNISYSFSSYAGIWGWATWKRTWDLFDYSFNVTDIEFKEKVYPFLKSKDAEKYWLNILHKCRRDGIDKSYWDYQLHLSLMFANKIHIIPSQNLVSNIGFNKNATHTFDSSSMYANKETNSILPLIHPSKITVNHRQDNKPYIVPIRKKIKRMVKRILNHGR